MDLLNYMDLVIVDLTVVGHLNFIDLVTVILNKNTERYKITKNT